MPKGTGRPKEDKVLGKAKRNARARAQGREPTSNKAGTGRVTRQTKVEARSIMGYGSKLKK